MGDDIYLADSSGVLSTPGLKEDSDSQHYFILLRKCYSSPVMRCDAPNNTDTQERTLKMNSIKQSYSSPGEKTWLRPTPSMGICDYT